MTKVKKRIVWTLSVVAFIVVLHITLPFILVHYVNKTIDNIPGYTGSISWLHVNLFRGAYQIHDLELLKEQGGITEPFFATQKLDLSVEWRALFHGEIVGELVFTNPALTFVPPATQDTTGQTGSDVDWTEPIKELMPLRINRFEILSGSISFKDPNAEPSVDIYLNNLNALASNLSNVTDSTVALPSRLTLSAVSLGEGRLQVDGGLNILKQTPDFDINLKFESVDLTAFNEFMLSYAKADLSKGTLNFYSEISGKDGELTGYVKPLLTDLKFVNWQEDKEKPLKLFWESIIGVVSELFENQKKDQFATKVPIEGTYDQVSPNLWQTLGNIIKNAFIQALRRDTDDSINLEDVGEENKKGP